jgi:phasin
VHAPFPEKSALRLPPADKGSGVVSQNRLQVAMHSPKTPMMNANPQAAAEQDRKSYRDLTTKLSLRGLDPAIPEGVRSLAEKTVARTREAYVRSMDAFEASVATFERSFDAAGQGAAAFNRKITDIARRNVNSSFDLATSLAGAKDLYDIMKLQAANWRKQIDALTAQAEEVCALSMKVTADTAEPIKEQVKRSVDKLRKAT